MNNKLGVYMKVFLDVTIDFLKPKKKTSKKEKIKEIFDKYTKHFDDWLRGTYKENTEEIKEVKEIGRITTEIRR